MRKVIGKRAYAAVFAAFLSTLLTGAGSKRGLSKKRKLLSKHREVPIAFKLPPVKKKLPNGEKTKEWVFRTKEEKFKRDTHFFHASIDEYKKDIEKLDDPDINVKGDKATFKEELRSRIKYLETGVNKFKEFYNNTRIAVEDKDDPTSGLLIKSVLIRKDFTLDNGVTRSKQQPPPWRRALAIKTYNPDILMDKRMKPIRGRLGPWKRHVLLLKTKAKPVTMEGPGVERNYYDLIFLYRKALKNGNCYMIEIYCHWQEDGGKDKDFAKRFYLMLKGLRF